MKPTNVWTLQSAGMRSLIGWHAAIMAVFLLAPVAVIVPLSFNTAPYFTYPLEGASWRWYGEFFGKREWTLALTNTLIVGGLSTILATCLGTAAALGLAEMKGRGKTAILALLISPIIVPLIVTAIALYFFFAGLGLNGTFAGVVLAHTLLGMPFVVLTVLGTLARFDRSLPKAAMSLGASRWRAFRSVTLPLLAPGVASGAVLAFATSLDEVVVVLFVAGPEQRTITRQMWTGINQELNPTIAAAATLMIIASTVLMLVVGRIQSRRQTL